jgi:hypothetical protein
MEPKNKAPDGGSGALKRFFARALGGKPTHRGQRHDYTGELATVTLAG